METIRPDFATRNRAPLPSKTELAEALVRVFVEDGLDLLEVVELAGEFFRIAGELLIERRHVESGR
jgi:hypothetical protein